MLVTVHVTLERDPYMEALHERAKVLADAEIAGVAQVRGVGRLVPEHEDVPYLGVRAVREEFIEKPVVLRGPEGVRRVVVQAVERGVPVAEGIPALVPRQGE